MCVILLSDIGPFIVSKFYVLSKVNKIKERVSFMLNNNTVKVNMFAHVDRYVSRIRKKLYTTTCIQFVLPCKGDLIIKKTKISV